MGRSVMPNALLEPEVVRATPRPHFPLWESSRGAAALILGFTALNLLYLLCDCPVDLAPDEAHYWDWSRRLDYCYYSKGPLVAWLIRANCELFGPSMPAVRFPALLGNALLLLAVHRLTLQTFRCERLALIAVALALTLPPLAAPAVLITIDGPFLCCWAWGCVFVGRRAWGVAGLMAALGVLAKYTMLLFPVCVGLYLLTDRHRRGELLRPGFWVLVAFTLVGLAPIAVWNVQQDWVGLRHVMTLAEGPRQAGFDPLAVPHFLAGQAGLLVGFWLTAWLAAVITRAPWRGAGESTALLWWLSVPVWATFLLASLRTRGQPNWPAAAYITGFVLVVGSLREWWSDPRSSVRRRVRFGLGAAVFVGLALTLTARYPGLVRPMLAELAPAPTTAQPAPIRKLDPTCRLSGWRSLAAVVDEVRERVRAEEGREPALAAMTWAIPGELAFYCQGHPEVYSFGPALADRHSQYDIWRPNPLADAQAFQGRTFVYVGDITPELLQAFDRADPPVEVLASDGGVPVADWKVWVLRGFRGFPAGRRPTGY